MAQAEEDTDDPSATSLVSAVSDADVLALPWPELIGFVKDSDQTSYPAAVKLLRHRLTFASKSSTQLSDDKDDFPNSLLPHICDLLIRRNPSTVSVECAAIVCSSSPEALATFVRVLDRDWKSLAGTSSSSQLLLLKWTSSLLVFSLPKSAAKSSNVSVDTVLLSILLTVHASVLDLLSKNIGSMSSSKSSRIFHQCVKLTRRFMLLGKHGMMANAVLKTLLSNEKIVEGTDSNSAKFAIIIGTATGCIVHKNWDCSEVDAVKSKIAKFYEKNILANAGKSEVSKIALESFDLFFKRFMTADLLETQLCASAERLMLRSPEFVIRIFNSIFKSVTFDVSKLFREKFVDSLLNNMKSTNERIRIDSLQLFATLSSRCTNPDELLKISEIVLKAFTAKSPTPEARALYFQALSKLPTPTANISSKIVSALIPLCQKEVTEIGVDSCFTAMRNATKSYMATTDSALIPSLASFMTSALVDTKSANIVRKNILQILTTIPFEDLAAKFNSKAITAQLEAIMRVLEKVQSHGAALVVDTGAKKENPVLVEGYLAFLFLARFAEWEKASGSEIGVWKLIETKKIFQTFLAQPAKSFVLNEKYYSKLLISANDQQSFLEVLTVLVTSNVLFSMLPNSSRSERLPFSNAWAHILVSNNIDHGVRRNAIIVVENLAKTSPEMLERINNVCRTGLGTVLERSEVFSRPNPSSLQTVTTPIAAAESGSAWGDDAKVLALSRASRILNAVQSLIPRSVSTRDDATLRATYSALQRLIVICSHPVLAAASGGGNDSWIRICWRAGIDPETVVAGMARETIERWMSDTIGDEREIDQTEGGFFASLMPGHFVEATCSAMSMLVRVCPDISLAAVMPGILKVLDNSVVAGVTQIDIAVWQGTEGVAVCDIHGRLKVTAVAKDDDDDLKGLNADEKWERELKKELQAKKQAGGGSSSSNSTNKSATSKGGKPVSAKAAAAAKAEKEAERLQLEKESATRKRIDALKNRVSIGLDAVEAIITGIAGTGDPVARDIFDVWVSRAIEAVLNVIERESVVIRRGKRGKRGPVLIGKRAIDVFRLMTKTTIDRLWRIVDMGWDIVTLRILGVEISEVGVSPELCSSDLSVVLGQLLAYAKSEYVASNPLTPGGFAYIFPLLRCLILRDGRTRNIKEKMRMDLIILASEILIAHCGLGGSPSIPRKEIVAALIELLNTMPRLHGAAREGLLTLCVSMEDAIANEEDLNDADFGESEKLVREFGKTDEESISNELLHALLSSEPVTRQSALKALQHLPAPAGSAAGLAAARVWQARFDSEESITIEADRVWEQWSGEATLDSNGIQGLVDLICNPVSEIRIAAGKSLMVALEPLQEETAGVMKQLFEIYKIKNVLPMPEYDDFGIVIPESLNKKDDWPARSGIARALHSCAPVIRTEFLLELLFDFLINQESLGDREESVRLQMLEAGVAAVNTETGKSLVNPLLKTFSDYLSSPAGASKTHDLIRESVVVLLGTVARHLDASDPKIPDVVNQLVETLKTPSEVVQVAVAECLPPLIKVMSSDDTGRLFDRLLRLLFLSPKYAERRGAAYGIAGAVKGRGIGSLKEFGIMGSLKDAIEDKKRYERREGALFAYEALCTTLGRLFEPHVIQILPLLLVCYGDSQHEVREATNYTCKAIMSKLSGHCVKLVMPSLLKGLEDKAWRTKTGSIEALGSMAALAPKQLSLSLPTIIPRLCEVLTDTHIKVQESAKQALNSFGSVIKNPEIQELVPELMAALIDPNENTQAALTALLETSFVHYIDSPSLALIVPILQRGLVERVTETKKKAAQIMGQMASLTDQKDLIPYLGTLLPGLKEVLVDPVPEARAIAAQALGSMFAKLGEENFPDLIPELLVTLKSETSAVDRAGAAQGLAEVLHGAGVGKLEPLMPDIINNAMSPRTYVREGFITLLIFLPATFGDSFQPYIGAIIPPILRGLADETDTVRETAMKAGRVVVRNYATTAVDLLLPELETGLFDENWRIRQSSIQLMGDLLYRIAGVSGKVDIDGTDDDSIGTEHNKKALISTLGEDRYVSVLSALYIARSDSNGIVRSAALHVWKSIVTNTPRTLKEILPVMIQMVIESLADENSEKRGVAARTLGDLVRKLGDLVLNELIPVLESGLDSEEASTREGVCIGMTEIMATSGKAQLVDFVAQCVPCVKKALLDPDPEVRGAAAQAFDMLHQHLGSKSIDEILPSLLNELKGGSSGNALEALKEIMSVRSAVVFPVLIPTLLVTPMTGFNARALASLISVAGNALNKRLSTILPVLMNGLDQKDAAVADIRETLLVLLRNVDDEGIYTLMPLLSEAFSQGSSSRVKASCDSFAIFCENTEMDVSDFAIEWFNRLLELFQGPPKYSSQLMQSAWTAVDALSKRIKKDDMERFVAPIRRSISGATQNFALNEELAGFCLPKGISPILPFFLQGLMYGNSDVREESAKGLGELVQRTNADGLKPFVTQITGPLIRIIGDRVVPGVKAAILTSLGLLLTKVPANLKPFLPQLQRTFIKSLSEPVLYVQTPARKCLTLLIGLQPRLDPLVVELTTGIKAAEEKSIKDTMWGSLLGLLRNLQGRDITDASKKTIESLIIDTLFNSGENDDSSRKFAAKCCLAYCVYLSKDEAKNLISSKILCKSVLDEPLSAFTKRHGLMEFLSCVLRSAPHMIISFQPFLASTTIKTLEGFDSNKSVVLEASVSSALSLLALEASGSCLLQASEKVELLTKLVNLSKEGLEVDARRIAVLGIKNLAKKHFDYVEPHLSLIVPILMTLVRERVIPIKLASERALLHLLCLSAENANPAVLSNYAASLDTASARNTTDYAKRVLSKLADKESDDEDDESDKEGI